MYDNFWQPYATPYQTRYNAPQQAFGSKLEVITCQREKRCRGVPDASNCERLAWLYIVRDHLTQKMSKEPLTLAGESEFLAAVNGKCGDAVWIIMDELAETVKLLHPRVYESVLKKLNDL